MRLTADTGESWLAKRLQGRFDPVLIILSPPRSCSTALARSFWQHPQFRWYLHEPYDRVWHRAGGRKSLEEAVHDALDVHTILRTTAHDATGIVVKEMTFQPGRMLPELLSAATLPIIVTVRDPRLTIWSRMRQRKKGGQQPVFPTTESGWCDLQAAVAVMRARGISYVIIDVTRLRSQPELLLPALCERLNLAFTTEMLSWPSLTDVALGHLLDEQRHWYTRVLTSTGFERPFEEIPSLDVFSADGMRAHVDECLRIYQEILADSRLLA